ncbi:hypothetical protein KPL70_014556 [Citrus sinensis]|nr:hypothetical protein KPL70_014556 [Citrus sinensis]
MATQNDSTFREGQSTTRPPYFDGNDYPYWKTRMRIYLQALDYEIWEIVNDGPFMPLTKNKVGEDIPKPSRDWNEFEKRKASLNSKAMNALFCALDKKEFHRVSSCESANEIWHKLEVVYEGTNQVKESKISRYTRQYELFQMEQNENVYSMYTRFTDIVNTLGALGKTFSNSEKVKKIIRSLPKEWRQKRTAIEEAKDLNVLPIDDLIGSLISYEEDLAAEKGHEEKKKNIALKVSKRESDEESKMDDEELAMLARRFRKFYKKNNEQRKFRGYKNKKEKKEPITCYECKKPGHIRPECPLLNKFKKKAMVATWDDSDEETRDDDEQQEMTNLALMAVGEESCDELDEVNDLPTYDELHDAFNDLHDELMKIDNLGKFDPKSDVGIFLGYSNSSKAYRVYNKRTLVVEESMHVTFDESNPSSTEKVVVDDNAEEEQQEEALNDNHEDAPHGIQEEHHEETNAAQNEGDPSRGVTTRSSLRNTCEHAAFISQIEPKSFADVENDESWIMTMQEELNQFERNNVWELVPNPEHQSIIDFSSCMSQEFEMSMMRELKYFLGLQVKQNEEGIFINQAKYVKDLLKRFGYENGTAKSTPMSTTIKLDKDEKCKEVDIKTYRGMIGSLLYLTASRPDIMFSVCLCARFQSCPKESHMLAVKRIFRYLIGTINLALWYSRGTHIDLTCYSDADFVGYKVDKKSTSGTCHFLGHSLVSWFSKKQNSVALSTTEAEYIAAVTVASGLSDTDKRQAGYGAECIQIESGLPDSVNGRPDTPKMLLTYISKSVFSNNSPLICFDIDVRACGSSAKLTAIHCGLVVHGCGLCCCSLPLEAVAQQFNNPL